MTTTLERPTASGVYLIDEASRFISATTPSALSEVSSPRRAHILKPSPRHLYRWASEGLVGGYLAGLKGDDIALTFLDLISMRMVAIMRSVGLRPAEIRFAHGALQSKRGWSHPFAMEPIWVGGLDIVIRDAGIPVSVTRYWQIAFDFMLEHLVPVHRIAFGADEHPTSWEPEHGIALNPEIRFGEPCLKGTRIPTDVIWGFYQAGDSMETIAESYRVPIELVKTAVVWEQHLAEAK